MTRRVDLNRPILRENDRIAADLRARFERTGILCLNLISSPGSGKTALLEQTLRRLPSSEGVAVLTGDIQSDEDARRLARCGFPVRQITTGGACHLDARMVAAGLEGWDLDRIRLLFVENVGNLVCPAAYDLGEAAKVVVLSVAEGEEKPLKYPAIFHRAALMILNKMDLLPHVPFNLERAWANAQRIRPGLEILEVSCTTGQGIEEWIRWVEARSRSRAEGSAAGA